MTKIAELRDRSDDQLNDQLSSLKKEQFNLRFQRATGQLEKTSRFKEVRHDIARIMTLLNQRGVTAVSSPATRGKAKAKAPAKTKPEAKAKAKKAK